MSLEIRRLRRIFVSGEKFFGTKGEKVMADGTNYPCGAVRVIRDEIEEAMAHCVAFYILRKTISARVRSFGIRIISIDRSDGVILVLYEASHGEIQKLTIAETHSYRTRVPVSTW